LEQGLAFGECEVFKAGNGDVSQGKDGGVVGGAGENAAGVKGKEIIAVIVMASAVEDDTSEGAGLESVGGNDVNLGVRSEFEEGAGAVKTGGAGDDVSGGVMLEDVVIETGEVVKVRVGKGDEVGDEGFWEAFEGETMGKGANVFFDGADGPLDVGDMAVGIDDVKMDVGKDGGQGDEFVVDVAGADVETTGLVKGDDGGKVAPHFGFLTGGSWERMCGENRGCVAEMQWKKGMRWM
jgi:hypothetical protein